MGKGRNRRKARRPRKKASLGNNTKINKLKIVHWNINGIMRDSNLEHLAEVLITEHIGICFLNETMLVHGTNDDLSCLSNFMVYSKERQFGSKREEG